MKVFWEGILIDEVPDRIHKPGEFFTRLVGVNVSSAGNGGTGVPGGTRISVEPIYIPRIRVQRRAGQILIEINSTRPLAYITLQRCQPYIHIFYFPWLLWDKEQL